ncbi:HD domain-containing protein [Agrobacterium vitis]|uniref:HD domain-containing protein n=1 Tax=Agrobacterium vitis TaxID=373 RepID=A0AAE2UXE9_AGRVI|nr:HD domain-containing protein [Agrobacterium vitis]MBF2715984.1 HD domain-containing protein [Agrobacterium vitis]MUZ66208.1 HD domain-containing protein [Agrobacterium vitis]MVA20935.1 HD domain-containing protein [Agrobacterium vitis]
MQKTKFDVLRQQLAFLIELDRLKSIVRQSPLINKSRRENSAEHSWHLALFALTLPEHAEGVDPLHVVKLLLLHDVVEIDAGDAPIHNQQVDRAALAEQEFAAAERIFGLLPDVQGQEMLALWLEFEEGKTPNACFAKALDRLQPLLLNTPTDGGTWAENGVSEQQVMERYGPAIEGGSPILWEQAKELVRAHFEGKKSE